MLVVSPVGKLRQLPASVKLVPGPARPVPIKPDVMPYVYGMNVSPEVIYIIRHAEKPRKPP